MQTNNQPKYEIVATEYCSFLYGRDGYEVTVQLTKLPNKWMVSQTIVLNEKLHERNLKIHDLETDATKLFLDCIKLMNEIAFEALTIAQ